MARKTFPKKIVKTRNSEQQKNISNVLAMESSELKNVKGEKKEILDEIKGALKNYSEIEKLLKVQGKELDKSQDNISKNNYKVLSLDHSIDIAKKKEKELKNDCNKQKVKIEKELKKINNIFDKTKSKLDFEVEDLEQDITSLQESKKSRLSELKDLSEKIKLSNKDILKKETKITNLSKDILKKEGQVEKIKASIENKELSDYICTAKLKEIRNKTDEAIGKKAIKEEELRAKEEKVELKSAEYEKLKNQMLGMIKREEKVNELIPKIKRIAEKVNLKINLE